MGRTTTDDTEDERNIMVMKQRSLGGSASHIKVGEIGYGLMGKIILLFHGI